MPRSTLAFYAPPPGLLTLACFLTGVWQAMLATTGLTLAIGCFMYHGAEEPGRRYRMQLGNMAACILGLPQREALDITASCSTTTSADMTRILPTPFNGDDGRTPLALTHPDRSVAEAAHDDMIDVPGVHLDKDGRLIGAVSCCVTRTEYGWHLTTKGEEASDQERARRRNVWNSIIGGAE